MAAMGAIEAFRAGGGGESRRRWCDNNFVSFCELRRDEKEWIRLAGLLLPHTPKTSAAHSLFSLTVDPHAFPHSQRPC